MDKKPLKPEEGAVMLEPDIRKYFPAKAKSVFDDILALVIDDRFHSHSEVREIIVGESSKSRLLYVVFVEREDCIRIVSARKLTTAERRCYEQGRFN